MSLWLARHGETEENAEGRILGRRDPPLSPAGVTQAEALAGRLRDAEVVAVRTRRAARAETAESWGDLGVEPVVLMARGIRSRDWEGWRIVDREEVLTCMRPSSRVTLFRFPGGGRSPSGARTRAARSVRAGPSPALVVAHAGTIRAALADSGASCSQSPRWRTARCWSYCSRRREPRSRRRLEQPLSRRTTLTRSPMLLPCRATCSTRPRRAPTLTLRL
jgi:probable phosphoglycerate mutase